MILKCASATVKNPSVLGVEFSTVKPTYIEKTSDSVYVSINNDTVSLAKVNRILNNIETVSLTGNIAAGSSTQIGLDKVAVTGTNTDRKLDPSLWNNTVRPAWYRAVATTDHNFL